MVVTRQLKGGAVPREAGWVVGCRGRSNWKEAQMRLKERLHLVHSEWRVCVCAQV